MNSYEALGVFIVAPSTLLYCLRRVIRPYRYSATYQRGRWRAIARAHGLADTGRAHEYIGTWGRITVVLDTNFVPAETLWLRARVLGMQHPSELAERLRANPILARFRHEARQGELHVSVPFRGNDLGADALEVWLEAIREGASQRSAYRD